MDSLVNSPLYRRMEALEIRVRDALARYTTNVEVTVLGAGVLAFTCLRADGKLDQDRLRVEAKVKRANRNVGIRAATLRSGKTMYYHTIGIDQAPRIIVMLLVFGCLDPSAVDQLAALAPM